MINKNYKHTPTDNSKDRSCTSKVLTTFKSNPRLADKVKQSLIGTLLFCGLTVGTCSMADTVFSNHQSAVLDKNIFGDYISVYDTINAENIKFYNKNYYRDIINFNIINSSNVINNNLIPDTLPSKPLVLVSQQKPDTVSINDNINTNTDNTNNATNTNNTKKSLKHKSFIEHGIASHMGHSLHGRKQASGERHNKNEMICAHKYLPFGTKIKVTDKKSGKSVIVRVTDRGPYGSGRVIDLSLAAAKKLGIEKSGLAKVKIEKVL